MQWKIIFPSAYNELHREPTKKGNYTCIGKAGGDDIRLFSCLNQIIPLILGIDDYQGNVEEKELEIEVINLRVLGTLCPVMTKMVTNWGHHTEGPG